MGGSHKYIMFNCNLTVRSLLKMGGVAKFIEISEYYKEYTFFN